MRISAGIFKGSFLCRPKLKSVRPTRPMVRQAVFDVLAAGVEGARVLDLFSGSGAFGLEALSRGAERVVFVENNRECLRVLKENIIRLDAAQRCFVAAADVFSAWKRLAEKNGCFQVVFADPPYGRGLAKKCLLGIGRYDIVCPAGIVVLEHYKKEILPERAGNFLLKRQKQYGDTVTSFFCRQTRINNDKQ